MCISNLHHIGDRSEFKYSDCNLDDSDTDYASVIGGWLVGIKLQDLLDSWLMLERARVLDESFFVFILVYDSEIMIKKEKCS